MELALQENREELQTKQSVYTICFVLLCVIDMLMGGAPGRVQMTASNCTGLIICVITLTGYRWKDFFQLPYLLWAAVGGAGTYLAIQWGLDNSYYPGRWISGVLVIYLYGFILLRLANRFLIERKLPKMNWPLFAGWCVMMLLMIFSKDNRIWPIMFFVCFGCFYLTEFSKEAYRTLLKGACNGIIIGFLIIQGFATLFRAYDQVRYIGMYANCNMNALFYLMVHTAILCKWYQFQKEGKAIGWRMFAGVGSCILIGYGMLTICRTAIVCMIVDEVLFLIIAQLTSKSRRYRFLKFASRFIAVLLVSLLSVPVVFSACRNIPAHLYSPLIMSEEESLGNKIQVNTDFYDEGYVTWEEFAEEFFGRFSTVFLSEKQQVRNKMEGLRYILFPVIDAHAAEETTYGTVAVKTKKAWGSGESSSEPVLTQKEDKLNPYLVRLAIYRSYLNRFNLFGHSQEEEGVWVTENSFAPHAHNLFIQIAFSNGMLAGTLFLLNIMLIFVLAITKVHRFSNEWEGILLFLFSFSFVGFGLFEVDWNMGQMSFFLFFFVQRMMLYFMSKQVVD